MPFLLTFFISLALAGPEAAWAALARPSASVEVSWRLYGPVDASALFKNDEHKVADPQSARERMEQALTEGDARSGAHGSDSGYILLLTVTPPPAGYLYAPFSQGQSDSERAALKELVRPLTVTIAAPDGGPVPIRIFYPPGSRKFDPYSELELPVYAERTVIAATLGSKPPQGWQPALTISGLLCSDSSCTPLRQSLTPDFTQTEIRKHLPAALAETFAQYRAFPESSGAGVQPQGGRDQPSTITDGKGAGSANGPGENGEQEKEGGAAGRQEISPNEAPPYSARFRPVYFQQGLEVSGIGRAALFGLLAGLILNFMPCVLPVISLKLGMLAGLGGMQGLRGDGETARRSRSRFRSYSLFFSLGVLAWFAVLFAVIGFAGMLWGQFFQSRSLLLGMAVLLFLLALSLFGVFRLPLFQLSGNAGDAGGARKGGLGRQAFFSGLLATLLATPCSGPLLGGVLGWAVGQPLHFLGVTLLCVALGMASPFILLSLSPGLARFLPRPGGWTLILEKLLGFLLFGTVLYLLTMLPVERTFIYLGAFILLGLSAWLWGRRSPQTQRSERMDSPSHAGVAVRNRKSAATALLSIGIAAMALYLAFAWQPEKSAGPRWLEFTAGSFEQRLGRENLLLDFTADWCINCRALEATALSPGNLARWAERYGLTYMKVDITGSNPVGEELLAALGSASIPLLAVFPAGEGYATPTVLRDLVSGSELEKALEESLGRQAGTSLNSEEHRP